MRKVILFNMMSLDGFFEGPGHDINWHSVDEEFNEFAIQQLDQAGGLLFGRVTYDLMASYWPTHLAIDDDPEVAARMNNLTKYVFSRGLEHAAWINTTLVRGDAVEELQKIKQQPGGDLYLFGSGNLARSLIRAGLIDEFRVMISPILLGAGTPLFQDVRAWIKLQLVESRTFQNGNVLVVYREET